MIHRILLAAAGSLALTTGAALAQSSAVGTAPGVPPVEAQRDVTQPDRANGASRSEREARDDFGAKRATGDQLGPPAGQVPSRDQVRQMLQKRGYSDIQNLHPQGDTYTGQAKKDGRTVQLRIDPQRAKIEEIGG